MAAEPRVISGVQLGLESTAGTAVAANRRILDWGIDITPVIPTDPIRPLGQRSPTGVVLGKEHSEGSIKGALGYNGIVYLLESLIQQASAVTPANSHVWTVTVTGSPTGGTFQIAFNSVNSSNIAYNASAATVKSTLEAMSTIGTGNVEVTGSAGGPWTVTFQAALAYTTLAMSLGANALTGGSSPSVTFGSTAASASRRRVYTLNQNDVQTYRTYTVEEGLSTGSTARKFAYGSVIDLMLSCSRRTTDLKAKMLGRALSDSQTMTSSPTDIAIVPVSFPQVDLYVGTSQLGMTKITDWLKLDLSVKGIRDALFTGDTSQSSFRELVDGDVEIMMGVDFVFGSTAAGYMTNLRAATQLFARIQAVGATIEGNYPYMIQIDMPFNFRNPKREESEGAYVASFDLMASYASSAGYALRATVQNGLTSL